MARKRKLPNQDAFDKAIRYIGDASEFHSDYMSQVKRRYKAYRGIVDEIKGTAEWTSKLYPPYIMHIVETTLSSLVDDKMRFKIRPRPTLEHHWNDQAGAMARLGAEAHQILFDWQIRNSDFRAQQRPFALQNAIAGMTVAKTFWGSREERRRVLVADEEELRDERGLQILDPRTGIPMTATKMREDVQVVPVYDGPITEVRDIHDFMWHEAATKIDNALYIIDRVWMSAEEYWAGYDQADPMWGPERGGWTEKQARQILGTAAEYSDEHEGRWEEEVRRTNRDLIEVCEVWDQRTGEVITVVNRSVLAAYKDKFPFFHEKPPFVVCSTQPDLFKVVGISQVEKIMALQEMLWDVANQRMDNLRLINNAVFFFRPDLEDPSAYVFEPGAQWPMEDPQQVGQWAPNPIPAEISLGAEGLIKGDLQNLAGGFPFSSGTDSQVVDQKTATGASIVTSLAQRSIDSGKAQVNMAWGQVAHQRMILNQQFIRMPTTATVLGADDEEQIVEIIPEILQGDFNVIPDPAPDAMMQQEEQASAQALFQIAMGAVPAFAALTQQGMARMINVEALWEDTLKAFGKQDTQRYFVSQTPQGEIPQQGGGGGGAPQQPGNEQPQGITGRNSIDQSVSPSSQLSLSPIQHLQQAQALSRGGARNV